METEYSGAWSLENMKAHIGTVLPTKIVGVEQHRSGSIRYAFVYHRSVDGRYWYTRTSEDEGRRISMELNEKQQAV